MEGDQPSDAVEWLNAIDSRARNGDESAQALLACARDALSQLRQRDTPPTAGRRGTNSQQRTEHDVPNRAQMKGLAGLRKSRNLTQSAVAERLGTDQAAVSRIERRGDVLVSTLREYLTAIGAESPRVVVDFGGEDFVLDLGLLP